MTRLQSAEFTFTLQKHQDISQQLVAVPNTPIMIFKTKGTLMAVLLSCCYLFAIAQLLLNYQVYKLMQFKTSVMSTGLTTESFVDIHGALTPASVEHFKPSWQNHSVLHHSSRDTVNLGNMGRPVDIDMDIYHDEYEKLFKSSGFNLLASNMMSLNRTLADVRPKGCAALNYPKILPKTSVVIIFYNEPWSTLWRTVHSVINRSPSYMQEIVLVNDASTEVDLTPSMLDDHAKKLDFDIRLFHMVTRIGSVKARNLGMAEATGEILVILDSHCEVTEGWLEPLVYRIVQDRTRIVTPMVDVIDAKTLAYHTSVLRYVGGIQWKLDYMWQLMQSSDIITLERNVTLPKKTPTIGGGLFAIDKTFWNKLGGFDEGFKIWGGDNLELSFKAWMCGGSMETMPCSRVGHISRQRAPYPFFAMNRKRLAEIWIDGHYKDFFYFYNPEIKAADEGDISDRLALRKQLNCKSFGWYIENVFPWSNLPDENSILAQVKHHTSELCLDVHLAVNKTKQPDNSLKAWKCNASNKNQIWLFNNRREIRHEAVCINASSPDRVTLSPCRGKSHQQWTYDNKTQQIVSKIGKCLDYDGLLEGVVYLSKCDVTSITQRWVLDMKQWYFSKAEQSKP